MIGIKQNGLCQDVGCIYTIGYFLNVLSNQICDLFIKLMIIIYLFSAGMLIAYLLTSLFRLFN